MLTARTTLGLSRKDLAEHVGVSAKQILRYETGEQDPTLDVAARLAAELGISIDQLAGRVAAPRSERRPPLVLVDGKPYAPVESGDTGAD